MEKNSNERRIAREAKARKIKAREEREASMERDRDFKNDLEKLNTALGDLKKELDKKELPIDSRHKHQIEGMKKYGAVNLSETQETKLIADDSVVSHKIVEIADISKKYRDHKDFTSKIIKKIKQSLR